MIEFQAPAVAGISVNIFDDGPSWWYVWYDNKRLGESCQQAVNTSIRSLSPSQSGTTLYLDASRERWWFIMASSCSDSTPVRE